MKVYDRLVNGTIEEARYAVSMIVGRDTQELTDIGVTKAAVETVAENCSDGVIAPMIYMAIGGAPLMFLYKGINTMDSMLGYKNDKYLYFGRCSAKLDDVANFFPARISGWLMVAAAFVCGMDGKNAAKIYRRARRNHATGGYQTLQPSDVRNCFSWHSDLPYHPHRRRVLDPVIPQQAAKEK